MNNKLEEELTSMLNNSYGISAELELLEMIKNKQLHIRAIIRKKLKIDMLLPNESIPAPPKGVGKVAYKNYIWQPVIIGDNHYFISMFANDVDSETGNIHTRIGHIQFWKDILDIKCGSPNEVLEKCEDYNTIKVYYPKTADSKKYGIYRKAQLSKYTIDNIRTIEDVTSLVNDFYKFLIKNKEENFLENKELFNKLEKEVKNNNKP